MHMTPSSLQAVRPRCSQCQRPISACLCHCVRPCASAVQLLVLQHPDELGHAKNTARLMHLCVTGSRLEVGEHFDAQALHALLHGPWMASSMDAPSMRTLLLYPDTPSDPQLPLAAPPALPLEWLQQPRQLRLVVLDGTWRKSRKMLYCNPGLQQLPRLSLQQAAPGRYAIRKAHAPHQLSSFEAAAYALAQLQGWDTSHPSLQQWLSAFDASMLHYQHLQQRGQQLRVQAQR